MRGFLTFTAVAVATASVAPASALTVAYQPGISTLGNNVKVFQDFNSLPLTTFLPIVFSPTLPTIGANVEILNKSVTNVGAQPLGSTGNYAAILNNGFLDVYLPKPAPVFSFLLGSLDPSNSVTIFFKDLSFQTFTGNEIINGQTFTLDGRVTFDAGRSSPIISALFRSGQNSMEVDDLASAAPELGIWGMMIAGFGMAGASLRYRRRKTIVTFA